MKLRAAILLSIAVCLITIPFSTPSSAMARPSSPNIDDDAAPAKLNSPDTRALRLSSVEGQVQVVQDGQVIADPALPNQPLFAGSQITTANDGRAEIQLEDGSIVRISPNTTVTFSVLEKQGTGTRTEVVLNSGLAYFELQPSNAEHNLRVNYGQTSFSATSFSVIRITEDAPPGDLAVLSGNIHLERGDALQLDIHGGESLALDANDIAQYTISESIQPDSWDTWNADRDQFLNAETTDRTAATNSLGNYMGVGMSDLDANGSWYNVPGQGYIWSPYEAQSGAGFDPYGYGHWVYYPRYGYVWVSGYDWGYAPFQCGLWNFYDSFGWGWAPGSGCNSWWGGGFYGGGDGGWYNIGAYPPGYHPPKRPFPGPIHPRPGPRPSQPVRFGAARPLVATVPVDRRPAAGASPITTHNYAPVTIAGRTVEPLRPLAPREAYNHAANTFVNRAAPPPGGYGAGIRPASGRPGQSAYASAGHSQSSSHSSSGSSGSSHAPSGGGGGASHASSGGGGGGGGGTHK